MKRSKSILAGLLLSLFALPAFLFAQSGRAPEPSAPNTTQAQQPAPTTTDTAKLEQVKLILANGFDNFVKELNDNGKLGYRLEKSLSYGGEGVRQSYAAVVRL